MDAENNNKVLNEAVLNKGDVGDVSKDVEDENIVKVNELDAENNNGDLNEADLINGDVEDTRKDVKDKNIVRSWQHVHNLLNSIELKKKKKDSSCS